MKSVLTIAGSDSSGGAGIQADLKTFHDFHIYGATAITAVTAQNRHRVGAIFKSPAILVAEQINLVMNDINPRIWKTGMLVNKEIVKTVANQVKKYQIESLVIDPVMISTSGRRLLSNDSIKYLIRTLIPLALVITPNIPEAETLTGIKIKNINNMEKAAKIIYGMGAKNIVVKGGHLETGKQAIDILFDGRKFYQLVSPKINNKVIRGTGCRFATAIAANIESTDPVATAVKKAKKYMDSIIE